MPRITQIIFHIVKGSWPLVMNGMSHNTIDRDAVYKSSSSVSFLRDSNVSISCSGKVSIVVEAMIHVVIHGTADV